MLKFKHTYKYYNSQFSRSKQLIKDAIMENDFLKNLDSSQVRELVDAMYSKEISKGEFVIKEGEAGYIIVIKLIVIYSFTFVSIDHIYMYQQKENFKLLKISKYLETWGLAKHLES